MRLLSLTATIAIAVTPMAARTTATTTTAAPPASPAVKAFTPTEEARFIALRKRANSFMLKGQVDSFVALMRADLTDDLGGLEGVKEKMAETEDRAGKVVKVLAEKMTRRNGQAQFWFEAKFERYPDEPLVMRFLFDEEGKLPGMGLSPKSSAKQDG